MLGNMPATQRELLYLSLSEEPILWLTECAQVLAASIGCSDVFDVIRPPDVARNAVGDWVPAGAGTATCQSCNHTIKQGLLVMVMPGAGIGLTVQCIVSLLCAGWETSCACHMHVATGSRC